MEADRVRLIARLLLIPALAAFPIVSLIAASLHKLEPTAAKPGHEGGASQKQWKIADQSCAASRCHGGYIADKNGRGGHEASVWGSYDPHAQAYDVLTSELAKRMMTILAEHDGSVPRDAAHAVRCLACHTSPVDASPTAAAHFGDDGVSCRSCHGEASKWLAAHTDAGLGKVHGADGRLKAYGNPLLAGLRFLGTTERRAETCVGCHVGAKDGVDGLPRREVDHDMIAAGHPRLVFDLASQSTRQPRHWRDRPQQDLPSEWASGQVAAIKALAELAISRTSGARLDFADQNCRQCHRSLPDHVTRPPSRVRKLGKPEWASAYSPALPWLSSGEEALNALRAVENARSDELSASLNRLLLAVSRKAPAPNPAALPALDAPLPEDREGLLIELRARLAVEPAGARLKNLRAALEESTKQALETR